MKLTRFGALLTFATWACVSMAADGLTAARSSYSAKATMDRFEATVKKQGLTVFARVDHAAGAARVNMRLRPTEVLIFGSPQGGTPLMECAQSTGIDLPLRALVWEDSAGQVWLGFNEVGYIAKRHGAENCPAVPALANGLMAMVQAALAR